MNATKRGKTFSESEEEGIHKDTLEREDIYMEWRTYCLDVLPVPLGLLINLAYHVWLWHKVREKYLHGPGAPRGCAPGPIM